MTATKTSFAHGQLKSIVERIERLEEEKKTIAGDIKEVYAEAKANGFDTKILRKVISLRKKEAAERKNKLRGGSVFAPMFDPVAVEVGFHTPRLSDAVDIVGEWAQRVGLNADSARTLAEAILVQQVDWVEAVTDLHDAGARWILDLGPGDILTRLTAPVIRGLGVGIVPAATRGGQRNLFTVGAAPAVNRPWSSYAPRVISLPDGSVKVSTKFTRLTGRSPILLAGMTPTTVDAAIVAAATNAGHWAELAGGGQVTEPIFDRRMAELRSRLGPPRRVLQRLG